VKLTRKLSDFFTLSQFNGQRRVEKARRINVLVSDPKLARCLRTAMRVNVALLKGNEKMKLRLAAALAVAGFATAVSAQAATITTLPFWDGSTSIHPWGGAGTNTYGEVLDAPGSSLTSFTFEVNNNGTAANYVAQVYAWSGSTTTGSPVGAALYTGPASILEAANGFQAVTVNTGGVAVTTGQRYEILLYDGSDDGVSGQWGLTPPFGVHPGVAGDVGFVFNNGPSDVNGTAGDYGSLAYSATFTDGVPEAATWAMMIAGFGLVGIAARRRKVALAA